MATLDLIDLYDMLVAEVTGIEWIALITGFHPEFRFERQFVDREGLRSDSPQRFYPLIPGEIYECRAARRRSYFFCIVGREVMWLDKIDVVAAIRKGRSDVIQA